jgi:RNA polymerase sigma factor (sigma-70 family)
VELVMISAQTQVEREHVLTQSCVRGDRHAFDQLWQSYHQRIFNFIYFRIGGIYEEAENLSQETFVRAWSAIRRGVQINSFGGWLYSISRNVINDWLRDNPGHLVEPLEEGVNEPTDPGSAHESLETKTYYEFLLQQLDEVLLVSNETSDAKIFGYLGKMAFMWFHCHGNSITAIRDELESHAKALGAVCPSIAQLNNWLSRGDILSALIRHLVQEHPGWVTGVISRALESMDLPELEAKISRLRWQKYLSFEEIAAETRLEISEVEKVMRRTTYTVTKEVSKQIKCSLHDLRRKD